LSTRTGIPLSRFALAYFDDKDYFEVLMPEDARLLGRLVSDGSEYFNAYYFVVYRKASAVYAKGRLEDSPCESAACVKRVRCC
jgi:hypothetical protein